MAIAPNSSNVSTLSTYKCTIFSISWAMLSGCPSEKMAI
jgi:hypothetical protein